CVGLPRRRDREYIAIAPKPPNLGGEVRVKAFGRRATQEINAGHPFVCDPADEPLANLRCHFEYRTAAIARATAARAAGLVGGAVERASRIDETGEGIGAIAAALERVDHILDP